MDLVIISGRSGSGKSTVLHILEDRGYYCIDNLPASLLLALVDRLSSKSPAISRVAVSIDARNISSDLLRLPQFIEQMNAKNLPVRIMFLDANIQTLLKRYSESRRKHPLSSTEVGLKEAIGRESELLEPISLLAGLTIDTSKMSLQGLTDLIIRQVIENEDTNMALLFQSFGFKNGVPVDADIVYDVRCLPNPYWESNLRTLTGRAAEVAKYLDAQSEVQEMLNDIRHYLRTWLPKYEENNRSYLTVAIGCTGGQHRSVYLCEKLASDFSPFISNVQVQHRELP
ncbi:MAG: RNase adapter RapZ [Gammaproteobacteria bacterium]|nr:RNase adapter RapZ [Gammaproteobacteria bacterium]